MSPRLTKAECERRLFEALPPLAGIPVVPGSIRQDPPPAPDIECQVQGVGILNVELVAIDGEHTRTRLANMFDTQEAWIRALHQLPPADQAAVESEFADTHLGVQFAESAGLRDRAVAMAAIQQEVLSRGSGYTGPLFDHTVPPDGLHGATIYRSQIMMNGPHLIAPSAGGWEPPQLNKIVTKLNDKRYVFSGQLHLFAYSTHDEPDGAVGGVDQILNCIREHLPTSQFTRVHIFNFAFGHHILSYPPP